MLQERYLADPAAAKVSYARALSTNANNTLAAAAWQRLESIDQNVRARLGRKPAGG
jgi:hypothetical protein